MIEIIQNSIVEFVFSFPTSWYESKSEEKGEGGEKRGTQEASGWPCCFKVERTASRKARELGDVSRKRTTLCTEKEREREIQEEKKRREKKREEVTLSQIKEEGLLFTISRMQSSSPAISHDLHENMNLEG